MNWYSQSISVITVAIIIMLSAVLHAEALGWVQHRRFHGKLWAAKIMLTMIMVHFVQIWMFAFGIYGVQFLPDASFVVQGVGETTLSLLDSVYYSATIYTTVGFGDIVPQGALRVFTGAEATTGLVLVACSAAALFMHFSRTDKRIP